MRALQGLLISACAIQDSSIVRTAQLSAGSEGVWGCWPADGDGNDFAAAGRLAGTPGLRHAALFRRRARHRG